MAGTAMADSRGRDFVMVRAQPGEGVERRMDHNHRWPNRREADQRKADAKFLSCRDFAASYKPLWRQQQLIPEPSSAGHSKNGVA